MMNLQRIKFVCSYVMICTFLSLLLTYASCMPVQAEENTDEDSVTSFIGRWKDKPMGAETMTLDLLSDHTGSLTLAGQTYQLEWSVENSLGNETLKFESADLKLFINGTEAGTAQYMNPPESLSLNIDGNEFLFMFKEELAGESSFDLKRGIVNGNTYTQEYLGIQILFPDNWVLASEEDLTAASGITEAVTDENLQQYLDSGKSVLDTAAWSEEGDISFKIQLANFGSTAEMIKISPETYVSLLLKKNEDNFRSKLEAKGITDIQINTGTVTLLDDSSPAIVMTGKRNGADYYEKKVIISQGLYGAWLTAVSVGEDQTDQAFSMVEAID